MLMIAVVIPCYKVKKQIINVLKSIGNEVTKIYVVDDKCPEASGIYVQQHIDDPRVQVLFNAINKGVGGAVMQGYTQALTDGCQIVVKLDGDGQMDASLIKNLVRPIQERKADYVKGNRFFEPSFLQRMPHARLIGNGVLSLINKFVNGYWNIMDPTNGFTAIHCVALTNLPLNKIEQRYFFESDMLFRLSLIGAVVADMPMRAKYEDETSNLNLGKVLLEFPQKYISRFLKRILYRYFIRDFNIGTLELVMGTLLIAMGVAIGAYHWYISIAKGIPATSGTVMLSGLPVILGFQLLLSALQYDILNMPKTPLCSQIE